MNRYARRLDAIEPAIVATMPLDAETEATLQRVAAHAGIDAVELRQEAARIAWATRGMTPDQCIAWAAAEAGCAPDDIRRDLEALLP